MRGVLLVSTANPGSIPRGRRYSHPGEVIVTLQGVAVGISSGVQVLNSEVPVLGQM